LIFHVFGTLPASLPTSPKFGLSTWGLCAGGGRLVGRANPNAPSKTKKSR
jgi:hypothetical protein